MSDVLLARILGACSLSGGTMPIRLIVADQAELQRAQGLLKGRRNNQRISFITAAAHKAEWHEILRRARLPVLAANAGEGEV